MECMSSKADDCFVALGAVTAVAAAYMMGWVAIDILGWIEVSKWQAQPENIGGVRFFTGAWFLGLAGIVVSMASE